MKGDNSVGRTRKRVSHKGYASLAATRAFDARWFSGASRSDPPPWPRPKRITRRRHEILEPSTYPSTDTTSAPGVPPQDSGPA